MVGGSGPVSGDECACEGVTHATCIQVGQPKGNLLTYYYYYYLLIIIKFRKLGLT